MQLETIYKSLGVSPEVYQYGQDILEQLKDRFEAVDAVAEYNQAKVLGAMQKNRVNAACFAATTGYGYDDVGRDTLEKVYADVFHTEAALVRPQITCGTHALAVALSANLLPGDAGAGLRRYLPHGGRPGTAPDHLRHPRSGCGSIGQSAARGRAALPRRQALRHPGGGHRHPGLRGLLKGIRRQLPPGGPAARRRF